MKPLKLIALAVSIVLLLFLAFGASTFISLWLALTQLIQAAA